MLRCYFAQLRTNLDVLHSGITWQPSTSVWFHSLGCWLIFDCSAFMGKEKMGGKWKENSPSLLMLYDLDLLYSSIPSPRLLWKVIFRCVLSVVPCHSCIHSLDKVVVVYGDEINPNLCRIPLLWTLSSCYLSLPESDLTACQTKLMTVLVCKRVCPFFYLFIVFIYCKSCSCGKAVINLDSFLSTHTVY